MIEELRAQAEALGIKVDGRWKEAKLLQVIADVSAQIDDPEPIESVHADTLEIDSVLPESVPYLSDRVAHMNNYALRIWLGQSPDMLKPERLERVKAGLTAQGWGDILDKLSLPDA